MFAVAVQFCATIWIGSRLGGIEKKVKRITTILGRSNNTHISVVMISIKLKELYPKKATLKKIHENHHCLHWVGTNLKHFTRYPFECCESTEVATWTSSKAFKLFSHHVNKHWTTTQAILNVLFSPRNGRVDSRWHREVAFWRLALPFWFDPQTYLI